MLSHIWMKVDSKLQYEELQIKFDFCHGRPTFHELLPFVQNSVCHTSFSEFSWLYFHLSGWKLVTSFYMKCYRSSSTFLTVDTLFHGLQISICWGRCATCIAEAILTVCLFNGQRAAGKRANSFWQLRPWHQLELLVCLQCCQKGKGFRLHWHSFVRVQIYYK